MPSAITAHRPVLVTGVGRSGTSAVARILHERLGVSMGPSFRAPDDINPRGYFEDLAFKDLNALLLRGGVHWGSYHRGLSRLVAMRIAAGRPWGVKDPRLCHLMPVYRTYLPKASIVWVDRSDDQIAASLRRSYHWTPEECRNLIAARRSDLELHVHGAHLLRLDLTNHRTDDDLAEALLSFLTTKGQHNGKD